MLNESLRKALKLLSEGKPVLVHDSRSREDETDIVFYAKYINPEVVYLMRTLGGGLICYVTSNEIAKVLGLPFMANIFLNYRKLKELAMKKLSYGDMPAFSVWVNHVNVKTGISDYDRSLTISKLHEVVEKIINGKVQEGIKQFYQEFQAPGHVPILIGRSLRVRRGHTELSLALAKAAGLLPSMVIVEMLDKGKSLSASKAKEIAKAINTVFIEGDEIVQVFGD